MSKRGRPPGSVRRKQVSISLQPDSEKEARRLAAERNEPIGATVEEGVRLISVVRHKRMTLEQALKILNRRSES